jgi:hypothetical protein
MRFAFLMLIPAALAVVGMGCRQIKTSQNPATDAAFRTEPEPEANREPGTDDESPLLLDDEPLLLLDDAPDVDPSAGPMADNSRCYVCHMNYMQEDIAVVHARSDMGCADCHGESDAHIADESWSWGGNGTAPDIMYRRDEVNPFCMSCHPKENIETDEHKPFFAGTTAEKDCADCHGKHRLAKRRAKWK